VIEGHIRPLDPAERIDANQHDCADARVMDPEGTALSSTNFTGAAVARKCRFLTAAGASVVVALTLTNEMIGVTGVISRRAAMPIVQPISNAQALNRRVSTPSTTAICASCLSVGLALTAIDEMIGGAGVLGCRAVFVLGVVGEVPPVAAMSRMDGRNRGHGQNRLRRATVAIALRVYKFAGFLKQ
jgi:hypothetical protein